MLTWLDVVVVISEINIWLVRFGSKARRCRVVSRCPVSVRTSDVNTPFTRNLLQSINSPV